MIITKILNNNFAIVSDNTEEKIVMGRGIAFQKKVGQKVDQNRIQKIFYQTNSDFDTKLTLLADQIPLEIFQVVEELVNLYKEKFGKSISDSIYLSLSDHLNFAVQQEKAGIPDRKILVWDIDNFYPEEYSIGLYGLARINALLHVHLPKEEASLITLHLLNADSSSTQNKNIQKVVQIVQEITDIIRYYFAIDFQTDSIYYHRLITHLRFFAQRVIQNIHTPDHLDDRDLFALLKEKYLQTYNCVLKIEQFMIKKYDFPLSIEEKMYLTLHIQKIIFEEDKNGQV